MTTPRTAALGNESDAADWARLRSHADEAAFAALFDRHNKAVYNFAFRRLGQWAAAEDVTQAVFMSLWRRAQEGNVDKLKGDSARPILYAMARHECLTHYRGDERRQRLQQKVEMSREAHGVAPDQAKDWVDAEDTMAAIDEALAVLTPDQRDVVELVAWAELSIADAARVLKVREGTVKSRLSRARAAMAQTRAAELVGREER